MVPGLTVRIVKNRAGRWRWCLYDAQFNMIGRSLRDFSEKVDCYLNFGAHCAMADADFQIVE